MVYVCLFVCGFLVLVHAHGPREQALRNLIRSSTIISGFWVMGPLATLKEDPSFGGFEPDFSDFENVFPPNAEKTDQTKSLEVMTLVHE